MNHSRSVCQDAVSCRRVAALPVEVAARCVFGLSARWPGQTEAGGSDGSVYQTAGRLLAWKPAGMITFIFFKPAETQWQHSDTLDFDQWFWFCSFTSSWARLNSSFNIFTDNKLLTWISCLSVSPPAGRQQLLQLWDAPLPSDSNYGDRQVMQHTWNTWRRACERRGESRHTRRGHRRVYTQRV